MKFGKVLTYNDVDEAMELIGKKVIHSDNFKEIETKADALASLWGRPTILTGVNDGPSALYPFSLEGNSRSQFIREVIDDEPNYKPYDLSDKNVRDSLRGRWFRDEYGNEVPVSLFDYHENRNVWHVNGYSSKSFLEKCKWLDGTPCGRLVDYEPGIQMPRDGKEDRNE